MTSNPFQKPRGFKLAALTCATAASLAMTLPALAQSTTTTGPYVGATVGKPDWQSERIGGVSGDSSRAAYKLYGGWRLNPNFAVEASGFSLGRLKGPLADAKAEGVAIDAVGILPWSNTLSGIARVGVGEVRTRAAGLGERNTAPKLGLGLQYQFNPTTALRGEWERYRIDAFNSKSNIDVFSLGAHVSF